MQTCDPWVFLSSYTPIFHPNGTGYFQENFVSKLFLNIYCSHEKDWNKSGAWYKDWGKSKVGAKEQQLNNPTKVQGKCDDLKVHIWGGTEYGWKSTN